jgi:hypothetical protein
MLSWEMQVKEVGTFDVSQAARILFSLMFTFYNANFYRLPLGWQRIVHRRFDLPWLLSVIVYVMLLEIIGPVSL